MMVQIPCLVHFELQNTQTPPRPLQYMLKHSKNANTSMWYLNIIFFNTWWLIFPKNNQELNNRLGFWNGNVIDVEVFAFFNACNMNMEVFQLSSLHFLNANNIKNMELFVIFWMVVISRTGGCFHFLEY